MDNKIELKTHKHHEAQAQVAHPSKPSKPQNQPELAVPKPAPPVSQSSNIDGNSNSKSGSSSKAKTTKEKKEQRESDSVRNSAWSMAKANITDNHKVGWDGMERSRGGRRSRRERGRVK